MRRGSFALFVAHGRFLHRLRQLEVAGGIHDLVLRPRDRGEDIIERTGWVPEISEVLEAESWILLLEQFYRVTLVEQAGVGGQAEAVVEPADYVEAEAVEGAGPN